MTRDVTGPIASVAIMGCGLIGAGWAALACKVGMPVTAWDPDASARQSFARRVDGLLDGMGGACGSASLVVTDTLAEAVADADLIQENAPEKIALKHELYALLEAASPAHAIIASSTSSFVWSELVQNLSTPDRLITAHPFNPVHIVPLVELFGRSYTVLDRAEAFYRILGKAPIRMRREAHGHIANRLSSALWREAVHIVAEGIAGVAEVDEALMQGPGLRWAVQGAHMTYHLGGGAGGLSHYLDHLGPSQERRWSTLGSPVLSAPVKQALIDGIAVATAGAPIDVLELERDHRLRAVLAARSAAR